jgi:hypothetical protein
MQDSVFWGFVMSFCIENYNFQTIFHIPFSVKRIFKKLVKLNLLIKFLVFKKAFKRATQKANSQHSQIKQNKQIKKISELNSKILLVNSFVFKKAKK